MKILYVHFRPAKNAAQIKAIADKVNLFKEVSVRMQHSQQIFKINISLPYRYLMVNNSKARQKFILAIE